MTFTMKRLVILGYGYVGAALARTVREAGVQVVASTRSAARADEITGQGVTALVLDDEPIAQLLPHVDRDTALVVTFPPDGTSDLRLAPLAARAGASLYISSTGVYGST